MSYGWIKDQPDVRDLTPQSPEVSSVMPLKVTAPSSVDLRKYCSPIRNQGELGSCTAHAGTSLIEFIENKLDHKSIDASRLFLYKVTRALMGETGDSGATIRDTMKALVLLGVPPEKYWPYQIETFDLEPNAILFALAENYKAQKYYRLDMAGGDGSGTLTNVKKNLANCMPVMFGFTVYTSINDGPNITFPTRKDRVDGGHAVLAVGYDDSHAVGAEKGALLIKNSWGENWGDKGYGWLPYRYITYGLAQDFWSLAAAGFVDFD